MNCQVDIIIVGDSLSGHAILDKLAASKPTIKLAFISKTFKSFTTHDYLNVEYFRGEVVFTDYKNRLYCCYLKDGSRIYGTHLIIASGEVCQPLTLNNKLVPCVFNNADDIPKTAKSQPAIVIGSQNSDAKFALEVAKKYKQVYLCVEGLTLKDLTPANAKKLDKAENLIVVPNTTLLKVVSKDGILQKVELSNYTTLNCSAIYTKDGAKPEVAFVSEMLIQKDELGYLVTAENAESTLVPKCFAVGNCAKKYTKIMEQLLVETILKDF
jgi:thioredoxin reductase